MPGGDRRRTHYRQTGKRAGIRQGIDEKEKEQWERFQKYGFSRCSFRPALSVFLPCRHVQIKTNQGGFLVGENPEKTHKTA